MAVLKPLLVGEANPYGGDPAFALYPAPDGSAGHRLCTKILGLSRKAYLEKFDRINLCSTKWSMREARETADRLCTDGEHEVFVLFGAKVTSAFLPGPWRGFRREEHCAGTFIILPHPSGLSRGWDAPGSIEWARRFFSEAGITL